GNLMTDPRETRTGAQDRADSGRDKNDARRTDDTWGGGKIAPLGMEVRGVTHFTYLGCWFWEREEPKGMRVQLHCTFGNARYPKQRRTLDVCIGSASFRLETSPSSPDL